MSIEIKLSRFNRTYRPDEPLEGKIITKLNSAISYQFIRLTVNGAVNLQVRGGSAGVIESLYGVIKPIPIVKKAVDIRSSGKIGSVTTEIPFSVILKDPKEENLEKFYETFHGGDVSIQDTQRHTLLTELKSGGFRVTGKVCTQCSLLDPIAGELTVEASAVPIESIDIHLIRVESILIGEKIATESSLIQTTQIADGDVCRGMPLPIYIILPRLLTCPTIFAGPFSVEFKVSIVITFSSVLSKKHSKADPKATKPWVYEFKFSRTWFDQIHQALVTLSTNLRGQRFSGPVLD
ncbi:UNVERIFIED_CONTAM: Vacuolar protein sorting-associated protein 26C [Sesamum angustifolium]|uniref:Vacuolar protein sorting-associated protein 26C n=1 Tax=Sesamum angustifolium TaxID=2727405 RepID=A0AAW2RJG6_9LAMI